MDSFLVQDLYLPNHKKVTKSNARDLRCAICKKDLYGTSITAKVKDGKIVFLCSKHLNSDGMLEDED